MRDGVTVGLGSQDGDVTAKSPSALQTLLASGRLHIVLKLVYSTDRYVLTGPVIVHIADERENSNADPNFPAFLKGVAFDPNNQSQWYNVVLPYVRGLVFSVASTADIHFAGPMFGSEVLPQIYLAVTMLRFQMAAHLPNLRQISFTIHTAGITASAFSERQMIAIEANEPIRAKERRVMRLPDVVEKYNLRALLECRSLTAISIDYIDCERTAHFVRVGDPFNLVRAVQMWLVQEFTQMGQNVTVNLNRAN
ncbi:hypothetical protein BKA66DRAFT_467140 [Pyrenochaeta sp. MPI-SDFR-AT-0127]|nr:hypothetical protein BKA66DRAFT_467140 [Pyrenochaeta sp. MPI-SDFR-AT-0127]